MVEILPRRQDGGLGAQSARLIFAAAERPGEWVSAEKVAICHIASGDLWAGAESQIAVLIRHLACRSELDLSAILLNDGRLAEEIRSCGVPLRIIPEREKNFLQIFSEAAESLCGKGIRVLHSHRYKENLLAALLSWRCHIPCMVRTQHGLLEPLDGFRYVKNGLIQWLDWQVSGRKADRVISVSSEMSTQLARRVGPAKVVTIPNGVDLTRVHSALSVVEAKTRLGIPADCWVLGAAGRLEPVKRLDIFLAAAKETAARCPNSRFVIAGDGRQNARLRDAAQALGVADRVRFLGHRNDIYDVLRAFDILVLCSDHEGLPMVLLEALGLGVPVVARNVGGIGEVIQDGANGVLVKSGNPAALAQACFQVLNDEPLRKCLALAGPALIATKFTAQQTADRVVQLYLSLGGKN